MLIFDCFINDEYRLLKNLKSMHIRRYAFEIVCQRIRHDKL